MDKPTQHTIKFLDYHECQKWIEEKYNIQFRSSEHDFWLWLVDHYDIHNGCTINLQVSQESDEDPESMEDPWIEQILGYFEEEFREYLEDEYLTLEIGW